MVCVVCACGVQMSRLAERRAATAAGSEPLDLVPSPAARQPREAEAPRRPRARRRPCGSSRSTASPLDDAAVPSPRRPPPPGPARARAASARAGSAAAWMRLSPARSSASARRARSSRWWSGVGEARRPLRFPQWVAMRSAESNGAPKAARAVGGEELDEPRWRSRRRTSACALAFAASSFVTISDGPSCRRWTAACSRCRPGPRRRSQRAAARRPRCGPGRRCTAA